MESNRCNPFALSNTSTWKPRTATMKEEIGKVKTNGGVSGRVLSPVGGLHPLFEL